ncbi:MAG: D-TA family PLP-dependent enzyme [Clostridium sp.]|nr:D-TA family PLP-dependent enzyme [Clostridium sp.]
MFENIYQLENTDQIVSPALIYYKDIIVDNINKMIQIAGGPQRLWPHVKSHKMSRLLELQMEMGISRFKCATIAEAEMAARCRAPHALIAYPLVGPNISRFLKLVETYPDTCFWAIGDDYGQIASLNRCAQENGARVHLLIDVNMGTNRTGVMIENVVSLYEQCVKLPAVCLKGLHCYDGNHGIADYAMREAAVKQVDEQVWKAAGELEKKGYDCSVFVMGGTPSFPCHARYKDVYLSPGTGVISDYGYGKKFTDEDFVPGGVIMTRVVSHARPGYFTLDLGYKGIASDPEGARGLIAGLDHVAEVGQNEEHWIWKMEPGYEDKAPAIGETLYVIPTHICPTSALYPSVPVAQGGAVTDVWEVTARNRSIGI